jgi:hypothetical protein
MASSSLLLPIMPDSLHIGLIALVTVNQQSVLTKGGWGSSHIPT